MKKQLFLLLAFSLIGIMANAADWDGVSIAADPPSGRVWELNAVSDGFNYVSTGGNRPPEFTSRWNENYINGFSGPSATSYHADHAWTKDGYLTLHANWDANMPIIYTGCISSKNAMTYPMFMEARVKLANCMLANNVWMISADETQELDMMESYPNSQVGREWLDARLHLSSHTFIRNPFTDYQPRDEEEVYGTWYWEKGRETWRGDWLRVGMYWRDPHHVEYFVNGEWVRTIEKNYHSFKDSLGNLSEHTTTFDALDKFGYTGGTGMSQPQHIIINMEQQSWLSDQNIYPTQDELKDENGKNVYLVDWIRVYDAVPPGGAISVTGISVSPIDINLNAGETATITHTISPSNATNKIVSWTTSNSTIATVNGAGVVTAVGQGTCTAEVTTVDGNFKGICTVHVTGSGTGNVPVTGVVLTPTSATIAAGGTRQLTATVTPNNATNKSVIWTSNNSSVASVNSSGLVTAVAAGSTTITVTTNEGAKTATCNITVTGGSTNVPVTGVSVSPTSVSVSAGSTTNLSATVAPGNATNQSVTWTSNNTSVATVNGSGVVTGVAVGSATITVNTNDGNKTATSAITVTGGTTPPSGTTIVIEAESFLNTGGTFNDGQVSGGGVNRGATTINWVNSGDWAEYTINVGEAGEYEIEYQISTPQDNAQVQIAFRGTTASTDNVPNNGQWDSYQALKAGSNANLTTGTQTMRITASGSNDWQWNMDKITLTKVGGGTTPIVVTGINVTPATATLTSAGATQNLNATVSPSNATNTAYSWSSNNTSVATVNSSGVVTAVANGTATITATTADQNKTDNCVVTVSISTPPAGQSPYGGSNRTIPGTIEAEDFDNGGEGVAYHDVDATNKGNNVAREDEGVDIEARDGGTTIGWISNGEWLEYTVNATAGTYKIEARVASNASGKKMLVKLGGTTLGTITAPNTGSWGTFQTVSIDNITVSGGNNKVLRLEFDGGSINLNWVKFTSSGGTPPSGNPIVVEAENLADNGGSYNDGHVPVGVGVNPGVGINWLNNGDWAEYNVNIPTDGEYEIVYNIASPNNNTTIQLSIDGTPANTTTVPNTGGWETYNSLTASDTENLTAGTRTIRLTAGPSTWTWNLDKFTLTRLGDMKSAKLTVPVALNIYPNPVGQELNIELSSEISENATISIYNTIGSVVLTQPLESKMEQIATDNLSNGMYILRINNGNEVVTQRFIKN